MQPTPNTTASSSSNSASSLTYAATVGANDNFLVVDVGYGTGLGSGASSSVTFNGVALTKKWGPVNDGNWASAEQWFLANPPVGTFNVVITAVGAAQIGSGATPYRNVDLSNSTGPASTNGGTTASASTGSIASDIDSIVVGAVATDSEGGITPDGTQLWEVEAVAADASFGGQYKTTAPATLNWTLVQTGFACGGFSLHGIPGGITSGLRRRVGRNRRWAVAGSY